MSVAPILVINPNSTQTVTEGIDNALEPLRAGGGAPIECLTLAEGPPGIESQADSDRVVGPLCSLIEQRSRDASAFIIACFSDPGLHAARETTARPVFGIAESAILTSLALGNRFGILSILPNSVVRHERALRSAGLQERLAGDLAIDMGVLELGDETKVLNRMTELGRRLRDEHRADVLIMGCAGMARYRKRLQSALALPVIDPTQAAVSFALGAVAVGY